MHKCLEENWYRPCGWQIGFPHSPAIAQITLSLVNLCLSLSKVECFCA